MYFVKCYCNKQFLGTGTKNTSFSFSQFPPQFPQNLPFKRDLHMVEPTIFLVLFTSYYPHHVKLKTLHKAGFFFLLYRRCEVSYFNHRPVNSLSNGTIYLDVLWLMNLVIQFSWVSPNTNCIAYIYIYVGLSNRTTKGILCL